MRLSFVFFLCGLEIGLEMDLIGIKKEAGNDTRPLVFINGGADGT